MPIYEYKCNNCENTSSIFFRSIKSVDTESVKCQHCASSSLKRLISRPGRIQSKGEPSEGDLRAVDPRKTVESMSRQYDNSGIDPGTGFDEVARQVAAGKSPETLKEVIKEARKKETKESSQTSKGKNKE
ncbi:MAG TPA: zinc ribbon domain-containing protein [Gammaproteobacteria bacterium]|jgi:putative FmdB family regulatory protein|nr:zinc ribbon domain-containing protein [Gammaproteobacteria bacterium]|tara:strand:+ start:116 stop:505 length:390 start_codon:yes stop_codon:yes gene_type:complete